MLCRFQNTTGVQLSSTPLFMECRKVKALSLAAFLFVANLVIFYCQLLPDQRSNTGKSTVNKVKGK